MKPMLAATCDNTDLLTYPVYVSPKLDGIRALTLGSGIVSRNLKPIRNHHIQNTVKDWSNAVQGYDGELLLGKHDETVFRRTTSAVSSYEGEPDFTFWVFDVPGLKSYGFEGRYQYLQEKERDWPAWMKLVPHYLVKNARDMRQLEEQFLGDGYEGAMVRSINGPYKEGRATVREGWLLKVKRFADAEAEVIGYEERMHNGNEAKTDLLGHTERSSHKENLVGRGDLGALVVRGVNGPYKGVEFRIGTGFDDTQRADIWSRRVELHGSIRKYKYFPSGSKDAPRFPVDLGPRLD